jgi:1-acyl-sn-glycerol-3-phosphate acyltransferase
MNLISRLFKIIFSIYAILAFIITFIIVVPCYFFIFNFYSTEKAPHLAHNLSRSWAYFLLIILFIRVKVANKHFINKDVAYIFISNHLSQLDILVAAVSSKNTFRFLAKAELTKIPIIGYVIRNLYVSVQRKNQTDRTKSVDTLRNSIYDGISVFLYPEGTRNKSEEKLLNLYDGAFKLAIETQAPLAILICYNSNKLLSPKYHLNLSPGTIYAEWSEPIITKGLTMDDLSVLKEKARNIIIDNLNKYERKHNKM